MATKPTDVTKSRNIKQPTREMLWGRSAGRCQFSGCNKVLYKTGLTQESINLSQKAHIYSFSEKGPRGWGIYKNKKEALNDIDNLMLVCHEHHKLIDDKPEEYYADLLIKWKKEHEERTYKATGIISEKKTNIVFYGSNIGKKKSVFNKMDAFNSIFPDRYPENEHPLTLSMKWEGEDKNEKFWEIEEENLEKKFKDIIIPIIERNENTHFSLFALADIPLMIKLGCLWGDISQVDVYQYLRNPKGWKWQDFPEGFDFRIEEPKDKTKTPVLALSISGKIVEDRITSILGEDISIWEVTVPEDHLYNDCIRNSRQLKMFIKALRKLIERIKSYNKDVPLNIFPAIGVSLAVELGRLRMPNSDTQWIIYNQDGHKKKFIKALTIGDKNVK